MKRMIRTATEVDSIDVAKINEFNRKALGQTDRTYYGLEDEYKSIIEELKNNGYEEWTRRAQYLERLDPEVVNLRNTVRVNPFAPNSAYSKLRREDPSGIVVVDPKHYWYYTHYYGSERTLEYRDCYLYVKR